MSQGPEGAQDQKPRKQVGLRICVARPFGMIGESRHEIFVLCRTVGSRPLTIKKQTWHIVSCFGHKFGAEDILLHSRGWTDSVELCVAGTLVLLN